MEAEELLDEFYIAYHGDDYSKAIELLNQVLLKEGKGSAWLYSRLSSCYYELRNYERALEYAKKAYKLWPTSPLVLWDYAGPLVMLGKEKKAITLLKRIQSMDTDLRTYGFADPQRSWMQSIKDDAYYLMGRSYYLIGEDALAKEAYLAHLATRKKGKRSIYSKKQVLKDLNKLDKN